MPNHKVVVDATLPVLPILIPLVVHFLLLSLVFLSSFLTQTFLFSHIVLILVGLWACHDKESVIAALSVIVVVVITILTDVVQLGLYFPEAQRQNGAGTTQAQRTWQFSAGMTILNLLFKPITVFLACIAVYVRVGGPLPPVLTGGGERGEYERLPGSDNIQRNQ